MDCLKGAASRNTGQKSRLVDSYNRTIQKKAMKYDKKLLIIQSSERWLDMMIFPQSFNMEMNEILKIYILE